MRADRIRENLGAVHVAGGVETSAIKDGKEEETQDGKAISDSVGRVCKLGNQGGVDAEINDAPNLCTGVSAGRVIRWR